MGEKSARAGGLPLLATTSNPIEVLYSPRSIAVVGASTKAGKRGRIILENLMAAGYPGDIYPINRNYTEVLGHRCYTSVSELPVVPDVAAICTPSAEAVDVLEDCGRFGIPAAAMVASGFAERGDAGAELQRRLVEIASRYSLKLAGPNTLGLMNRQSRVCYWASLVPSEEPSGVAAVVQSGALAVSLMAPLKDRGVAFEAVAMPGNEAIITASDHIGYLVERADIRVLAVLIEGLRDPQGFVAAAKIAAARGKRIVALKVGRSEGGRSAAAAHTASLAGSDGVFDAVCRRLGVIRVEDVDELIETILLARSGSIPKSPRIVVTSVSGAGCGIVADVAAGIGLPLKAISPPTSAKLSKILQGASVSNPLDVGIAFDAPGSYETCLEVLNSSTEYDLQLTMLNCSRVTDTSIEFYRSLVRQSVSIGRAGSSRSIVSTFSSGRFDDVIRETASLAEVPVLQGVRESLLAIKRLAASTEQIDYLLRNNESPLCESTVASSDAADAAPSTITGAALLEKYGINAPHEIHARSASEASVAAQLIGYPVAMKLHPTDIEHKSDIGGVALNLGDESSVREAFEGMAADVSSRAGRASFRGVAIQEMIQGGTELIVGFRRDPQFGPVVVVGMGGIFVELLRDFALEVPPIDAQMAFRMLSSLRGYPLLEGMRGQGGSDIDAAAEVIMQMSSLACDHCHELVSFEINPLLVLEQGVSAVDYLLTRETSPPREASSGLEGDRFV